MKKNSYFKIGTVLILSLMCTRCNDSVDLFEDGIPEIVHPELDARAELFDRAPYLYEEVDNPYEVYGRIVYNQLKYNLAEDPIELLPEFKRDKFRKSYDELEKEYGGLDVQEVLLKARDKNLFDDNGYFIFKDFFDGFLNQLDLSADTEEVWKYLVDYEQKLKKDESSKIAREVLLAYSSMLRHLIKYNYEVSEFSNEAALSIPNAKVAGINCLFGIKISCWTQQAGLSIVGFFASLIGSIINPAAGGLIWGSIVNAGLATTATTFIKGVGSAYANSTCGCGSTLPACITPTAMRLIIDDCEDVHSWQIYGGGTSPEYFSYSVQNGVFPEFNDAVNVGQTLNKLIRVRQLNMSQNVIVTCVVHCTDGSNYAKANSFNVNAVKNGVSDIVFTGATSVPVGDTEKYYVYGATQVSNSNLSYTFYSNFAGQIVETGPDYAEIKWNVAISHTPYATAYCNVHNSCSGAVGHKNVQVSTY